MRCAQCAMIWCGIELYRSAPRFNKKPNRLSVCLRPHIAPERIFFMKAGNARFGTSLWRDVLSCIWRKLGRRFQEDDPENNVESWWALKESPCINAATNFDDIRLKFRLQGLMMISICKPSWVANYYEIVLIHPNKDEIHARPYADTGWFGGGFRRYNIRQDKVV